MKPVVTLTLNPAIDQITDVDRVEPDRKLRMARPRYDPGGGGINVARAVRNLGGASLAVYTAGGATGDLLEQRLTDEQVPQRRVGIEGITRTNPNITERSSGRMYRFIMPGPSLDADAIARARQAVLEAMDDGACLVISGSTPPDTPPTCYAELAEAVAQRGGRVLLDTSGACLRRTLQAGVFLVKPNLRELSELVGEPLEGDASIRRAAGELIETGQAQAVVVSLGGGGALLVARETTRRVTAPTVTVRSKVGAGDSMVAGLALAIARGWSLADAVQLGTAAGSAAVKTPGTELCRGEDAWQLYEQMQSAGAAPPSPERQHHE